MALTEAQKKKFQKIRRNKGRDAARAYKQKMLNKGEQPSSDAGLAVPEPISFDINDPQSIAQAQEEANRRAVKASTPNIERQTGSRQVTTDPATGQTTVKEQLSKEQQDLYNQRIGLQNQYNAMMQGFMSQGQGQQMPTPYGQAQGPSIPQTPSVGLPGTMPTGPSIPQTPSVGLMGAPSHQMQPQLQPLQPGQFQGPALPQQGSINQYQMPQPPQVQGAIGIPQVAQQDSFRDVQGRMFQDAMTDYEEDTEKGIARQRDLLEQQLANEGLKPGTEQYRRRFEQFQESAQDARRRVRRDAYRDSFGISDQAFRADLAGGAQQFGQQAQQFGMRSSDADRQLSSQLAVNRARQGQQAQQFGQGMALDQRALDRQAQGFGQQLAGAQETRAAQAQGFGQQLAGMQEGRAAQAQQFGQGMQSYLTPYQLAAQFSGLAGQYESPNFGAVQQIGTTPVDYAGLGLGMGQLGLGRDELAARERIARMNAATARATAGAGSLGLGDRMALIDAQKEADLQLMIENQIGQQGNYSGI